MRISGRLSVVKEKIRQAAVWCERNFILWMRSLHARLWRYPKLRPALVWIRKHAHNLRIYFKTHPKARLASWIVGPPGFFLLFLMFIVWIETPGNRALRNIQNQVASEVYTSDSVLIGRYFIQDRTEVSYENISPAVIDALIATEDNRFYTHEGIDYRSLGRVLVKSILQQDESAGGGSTLTQQLAKNLYPRRHYWILPILLNKMREYRIAGKLEDLYTKEELLTLYLNTVPFADNVFGIEAAADRFFSTNAKSLDATQAALLVGMLKATTSYNPRLYPDRALTRRNVVLSQMAKYNKLPRKTTDSLKQLPLGLRYNRTSHHEGLAPYFREQVKMQVLEWCETHEKEDGTPYNLFADGLKIYTTIDSRLQGAAEKAMNRQMAEIQSIFDQHWGNEKPWKGKEEVLEQAIQHSPRYQQLIAQGLTEDEVLAEMTKPQPMLLFTWQGPREAMVSPIDSIIHHLQFLHGGFLAMEPRTGEIKAWVGGINHDFFQFDHVKVSTKRQVGSVFKPIVYATAIEQGAQPCELVSASQQTYTDEEGKLWTPRNSNQDYEVVYTMRGALAYSVNTVAAKFIDRAGVQRTMDLARRMGITSELPDVPSISLGSSSISLMEMTTAYACLANEGMPIAPYYISSIRDLDGNEFQDFKPGQPTERAMKKETAQLVNSMLRTVVTEGTASRIRWKYNVYNDLAGKTGTTQSNADGWFMSYSPHLVMGAWVGADDPRIRFRNTELGQGANTALPITGYFLQEINALPAFRQWTNSRFNPLSALLEEKLDCDLYELSDSLQLKIMRTLASRDSILRADTAAVVPETFLQFLYLRKQKLQRAQQHSDSLRVIELEDQMLEEN
ncbi:MAG TPA: penicillin-binding protein [Cytophagales bacterium]|jgi:penicillin-binding protein 1A|nr:penicillin-binding protein [Cytophagales bacterium]